MEWFYKLYSIYVVRKYNMPASTKIKFPFYCKGNEYIKYGKNVLLDRGTRIEAWDNYNGRKYFPRIIIGNNVIINPNIHIGAINEVNIGNDVLIGANVLITDHSHGKINQAELKKTPMKRNLYSKGKTIIKDNVWIGDNVVILPGVTIGKNSIIGANSVVTHNVDNNVVVAGNPAKVIKRI